MMKVRTLTQHFFIGVDGGASKTIVCLEDSAGNCLGSATTGPANIRISVEQAWQSIFSALENILQPLAMQLTNPAFSFHAGMGLAGCEMQEAYQTFLHSPHPFKTLAVTSDAHIACLGAHGGEDGAIIIAGTGVVGFQLQQGQTTKVGGWGFPHDDEGGGAWLGWQAVRLTLQWLDGRLPSSGLTQAVYASFGENAERLLTWLHAASSTLFAELAPLVINQAKIGDESAIQLLQQAAQALNVIGCVLHTRALEKNKSLPCALIGSITPFLEPYLDISLRARLRPAQFSPEEGAILLIKGEENKDC